MKMAKRLPHAHQSEFVGLPMAENAALHSSTCPPCCAAKTANGRKEPTTVTKPENPLPALMQMLGDLVDGDTLAELVAIMAEPDETAVLLAIGVMQGRLERLMLGEDISEEDAAQRARQVAEGVREAWMALHRARNA